MVDVVVLRRRADDDLLRARRRGARSAFSLSVKRPVHSSTMSTPSSFQRELRRVFLGDDLRRACRRTSMRRLRARVARVLGAAVDGVVVVEVRERLGVGEVVDGDDLEVFRQLALDERADDAATDAAEAVDGDLRGHGARKLVRHWPPGNPADSARSTRASAAEAPAGSHARHVASGQRFLANEARRAVVVALQGWRTSSSRRPRGCRDNLRRTTTTRYTSFRFAPSMSRAAPAR